MVDSQARASAVASVLSGKSIRKTATEHGVARSSLLRWVDEHRKKTAELAKTEGDTRPMIKVPARLEDLIFESLVEEVKAMVQVGKECQDPEFIRQNPNGVAGYLQVLGMRNDRLVAILSAAIARRGQ